MQHDDILDYIDAEDDQSLRMAGFGPRFGAMLIDGIIVFLFMIMLAFLLFAILFISDSENVGSIAIFGVLFYYLGFPIINILYRSIFESSKFQGSPGKMVVGIKVVGRSGGRISFLRALGRNLSKIISAIIIYIGYLMVLWTKDKQALHDMMTDTYVVIKG